MKLKIFSMFLALAIVTAPGLMAAQVDLSYLQNIINGLRQQVSALQWRSQVAATANAPAAPSYADLASTLQQKINDLRAQILQTLQGQQTTGQNQTAQAQATPGTCPGGATMPRGTNGQTIRCDGTRWVASSVIVNDGINTGIGAGPIPGTKLNVKTADNLAIAAGSTAGGGTGVIGYSDDGTGVLGTSQLGRGVRGESPSGRAVEAKSFNGYGIYSWGSPNTKNYFEGKVGIGVLDPLVALDVSGKVRIIAPLPGGVALSVGGGQVRISDLAGSGNAYACLDDRGNLFRSLTPCR